eukprot:scaffold1143_cov107-Isochrysis_galbana.AAC.5
MATLVTGSGAPPCARARAAPCPRSTPSADASTHCTVPRGGQGGGVGMAGRGWADSNGRLRWSSARQVASLHGMQTGDNCPDLFCEYGVNRTGTA